MADSKDTPAAPEEHVLENQSFYNPALTGSGTILSDGTIGAPLPDPSVQRGTTELPRLTHRSAAVVPEARPAGKSSRTRRTKAEIDASTPASPDGDK